MVTHFHYLPISCLYMCIIYKHRTICLVCISDTTIMRAANPFRFTKDRVITREECTFSNH